MERHTFIVDLIKDYKVGAEIGTRRGELANRILKEWKGKLYIIDAWRHIEGLVDMNNPDHNGQLDNMAHAFMALYEFGERVCIVRELSILAADLFENNSLDFVYLDAGHDKKSVTDDLEAWYPKVREGGIIMGDDYFDALFHLEGVEDSTTLIEVKSAVDAFGERIGKKVLTFDTHHPLLDNKSAEKLLKQWWINK